MSASSWDGGSGGSWGSGWGPYGNHDYRNDRGVTSPPTTPFVEALPIPAVLQPVAQLTPAATEVQVAGEAPRVPHQRWSEFLPQKLYEIHTREALWSFHPEGATYQ